MSKYSSIKQSKHMFGSRDEDDEDDDDAVVISNTQKKLNSNIDLNNKLDVSSGGKSLKNSMERDSFLNAFLDRDSNQKHENLPFKSHHEKKKGETTSLSPVPKPRPRKDTQTPHPSVNDKIMEGQKTEQPRYETKNQLRHTTSDQLNHKSKTLQSYSVNNELRSDQQSRKFESSLTTDHSRYRYEHGDQKQEMEHDEVIKHSKAKPEYEQENLRQEKRRTEHRRSEDFIQKAKIDFNDDLRESVRKSSKRKDGETFERVKEKETSKYKADNEYYNESIVKTDSHHPNRENSGLELNPKSPKPKSRPDQIFRSSQDFKSDVDKKSTLDAYNKNLSKFNDLFDNPKPTEMKDDKQMEKTRFGVSKFQEREKTIEKDKVREKGKDRDNVEHTNIRTRTKSFEKDERIRREKSFEKEKAEKRKETERDERIRREKSFEKEKAGKRKETVSERDESEKMKDKRLNEFTIDKEKVHGSEHLKKDQEEIDNLFNIGGRGSVKKSSERGEEMSRNIEKGNGDKKPEPKKRMNLEERKVDEAIISDIGNKRNIKTNDARTLREQSDTKGSPRLQLTRQQRVAEEPDQVERKDELDHLFDAGSKRSVSMKKEKDKSDKIKEHLRRSNESLRNERSEEISRKKTEPRATPRLVDKKGPLKANVPLEQVTKSPDLKNSPNKKNGKSPTTGMMKPLATSRTKSRSLTNISNLVSPRSKSPVSYDDVCNMDAETLRHQIYTDWLQRKRSFTKEQSKIVKQKEETEKEEKERTARDRRIDAQKSFEAWGEKKKDVIRNKKLEEKKKIQEQKEKDDEKLQKTMDAQKFFQSWKQNKDEELKAKKTKKKREENSKKKRETSDKMERTEDAKKVFENWKVKKEEVLKEASREKRKHKKKEEEAELDRLEKKQEARRSYESWKEKKEKQRPMSATALQQRPWCPSSRQRGNAIPDTVQPVIIRNKPPSPRIRTLSATSRLQSTSSKRSK